MSTHNISRVSTLAFVASVLLTSTFAASAQVSLNTLGSPHTESFDTLPATGSATWTNNSTIPGWFHARTGSGTTIVASNGNSNAGNLYSFGTGAATDRALGSVGSGNAAIGNLFWGIRLQNNTGATITNLAISYTGEQWRNSAAAAQTISFSYLVGSPTVAGTLVEFQSAGVAVAALDFTSPITGGTAGALDGNAAANRVVITSTITGLSIPNGTEVMLRWSDPDQAGADHGLSIDDLSVTPTAGGPVAPNLSINNVTVTEGNGGTVPATFTVGLSAPAGPGGVTFDISATDNTATLANNDFVANTLTGQTIPAGSSTYAFTVTVNGDTTPEPNETFFVNVTNVTGATVTDGQGLGTINNDDITVTLIHDIQGPGASSPVVGSSVTVQAIVTGVRSNGFFLQEEEAQYDADPATSEGLSVFVGAAPPAAVAVGNLVQVTGTVAEFIPTQDPLQPPLTQLTGPTVVLLSAGNPLPAPVALTASFPSPSGSHDQLERLEGMRVSLASLTVSGPTLGSINEANATATSSGIFYGVVTGNSRPFREAGIQAPDPAPAGTIPPIPRFDSNPERIRVDSDNLVGGPTIDVGAGAVVSNLVGPLDYTFRTYTINPDPSSPPTVSGGPTAAAVTAPTNTEFTVASYNLQRFFDTVNDPAIGEPVLTSTAFANRLAKGSLGIRNFLRFPDIVGIVECENLSTLQALATQISNDAIANSQPDPQYLAFLVEGNDVGGIDVGFLVKTATVFGSTPRVTVNSVTQFGLNDLFTNPDTSTELLNDRPPLVLNAVVNHPSGANFPVVVIVNHLRSLNSVGDPSPGSNGWATIGERVRSKRLEQAEFLANLVQNRQTTNPTEAIVLVGDFNAFEVNDGMGDSMGVIGGTPVPDNQTAVSGDGIDLVNPDLVNLASTASPQQRYSFVFDGNAQSLDHILVNTPLVNGTLTRRQEHARINADFPETARNNTVSVVRLADHDPVVSYFEVSGFSSADVSLTKTDSPDPVTPGSNLTYTVTAANGGPAVATNASWTDTLPAGTTFVSLSTAMGWTCTTPAVGASGTVSCANASFAVGNSPFTLVVNVDGATAAGTIISNMASITSTTADPNTGNDSATATTTVGAGSADLSVTKSASPDPVTAGNSLTYSITASNAGPSLAASVSLTDTLPVGTTFVSLTAPGGWTCTTPAVGASGTVSCSNASVAIGNAAFTLVVNVDGGVAAGTVISNTASITSTTSDPNTGNNSGTATATVGAGSADLSVTKTAAAVVNAGSNLSYSITAANAGPSNAASVSLTDTLPAGTTFVSLSAAGGWSCTTPAVGASGTVTCTNVSFATGSAAFTLVVNVGAQVTGGTVLSNTAAVTASTSDPNTANNSATAASTVFTPASVSGTKQAAGNLVPGGAVIYTITLSNAGVGTQTDNAGDEFVDVLPAGLTLVSASASSGTAAANLGTNTVTWNGSIPVAGNVTLTIQASINPGIPVGTTITNQAAINFDADGNGTNEASALTDDPVTGAAADGTAIVVVGLATPIPALNGWMMLLLIALLTLMALHAQRRSSI